MPATRAPGPRSPDRQPQQPLLAGSPRLSDDHLGLLQSCAQVVKLARGKPLLTDLQGQVVAVRSGRVKLLLNSSDRGREHLLHFLGPGELYGDFFYEEPLRPVVVEAAEDAVLLVVPRADFERWLGSRPDFAVTALRTVWRCLQVLEERFEGLAFQAVPVRLARQLLAFARERGTPTAEGIRIELGCSQMELGAFIGASREMVNSSLGVLRREGVITLEGPGRLVVRRPEALQALADGGGGEPA